MEPDPASVPQQHEQRRALPHFQEATSLRGRVEVANSEQHKACHSVADNENKEIPTVTSRYAVKYKK